MRVYVVIYHDKYDDGTYKDVDEVFDSQEKAQAYKKSQVHPNWYTIEGWEVK